VAASRRYVGFGLHQVVEYVLALVLFASVAHTSGATQLLCLALGGALVVLNALSPAPFGVLRRLSYRAHHGLDLLLAASCVVAVIVWHHDLGGSGLAFGLMCAVIVLGFERTTRYTARVPLRQRSSDLAVALETLGPATRALRNESARTFGRVAGRGKRWLRASGRAGERSSG